MDRIAKLGIATYRFRFDGLERKEAEINARLGIFFLFKEREIMLHEKSRANTLYANIYIYKDYNLNIKLNNKDNYFSAKTAITWLNWEKLTDILRTYRQTDIVLIKTASLLKICRNISLSIYSFKRGETLTTKKIFII